MMLIVLRLITDTLVEAKVVVLKGHI